jgi:hypothetical protein
VNSLTRSRPEQEIPETPQPQADTNFNRREVLTRMLGGGALVFGLFGAAGNFAAPIAADKATRRELEADKITKPDPEALKLQGDRILNFQQ